MSGLGLVARADNSGLATQTWELWRHMRPERTLIVLSRWLTRGSCQPERYNGIGDVRITPKYPTSRDAQWLAYGVDTVFSAETFYGNKVYEECWRRGVKTVLQANPELFDGERADFYRPATDWRMDVLPESAEVLPVPVNRDLLRPDFHVPSEFTFYHVHSTAMEDRNGTGLVLSACRYMKQPSTLLIRGEGQQWVKQIGPVTVEWLGPYDGAYHEHYPNGIDALVLPRRFGGLCLPVQEAASLGLPIIVLDTDPYRELVVPQCLVPGHPLRTVPMKGGQFTIHGCAGKTLGAAMDQLVESREVAQKASALSEAWAANHSWTKLLPMYQETLR